MQRIQLPKFHLNNAWILFWTVIIVLPVIAAKLLVHYMGWEVMAMNTIFSGLIASCFFLMGFLLSGVLADYKESEKIPDDIASSLWNMYVDLIYLYDQKKLGTIKDGMNGVHALSQSFLDWFHGKSKTENVMEKIVQLNGIFGTIEPDTQYLYIHRLKGELALLNKVLFRVDTIKYTNFISSGYHISVFITTIVCTGLIFAEMDPFIEGMFFTGLISFVMVFLLSMIHHLDDPFDYTNRYASENVQLDPIQKAMHEMDVLAKARNLV